MAEEDYSKYDKNTDDKEQKPREVIPGSFGRERGALGKALNRYSDIDKAMGYDKEEKEK